jgi:hypothetical protein
MKTLEISVKRQLIRYLTMNNMIMPDQSAYLAKHSTTTCLHKVIDEWLENMDQGYIIGACFLDISKCFDAIAHSILIKKTTEIWD